MNQYFTAQEANEKIGKVIRTLREFSGVPAGTTGTVTGRYPSGYPPAKVYGLDITWNLPRQGKPLVDGFSKDEYDEFLEEVR